MGSYTVSWVLLRTTGHHLPYGIIHRVVGPSQNYGALPAVWDHTPCRGSFSELWGITCSMRSYTVSWVLLRTTGHHLPYEIIHRVVGPSQNYGASPAVWDHTPCRGSFSELRGITCHMGSYTVSWVLQLVTSNRFCSSRKLF